GRERSSRAHSRTRSAVASDTRPRALPDSTSDTVDWETPAHRATSMLVGRPMWGTILCTPPVIRSARIRMTLFGTHIAAVLTAVPVAAGAVFGAEAST